MLGDGLVVVLLCAVGLVLRAFKRVLCRAQLVLHVTQRAVRFVATLGSVLACLIQLGHILLASLDGCVQCLERRISLRGGFSGLLCRGVLLFRQDACFMQCRLPRSDLFCRLGQRHLHRRGVARPRIDLFRITGERPPHEFARQVTRDD